MRYGVRLGPHRSMREMADEICISGINGLRGVTPKPSPSGYMRVIVKLRVRMRRKQVIVRAEIKNG